MPTVPQDINSRQVAAFSASLIRAFGGRALIIAQDQADASVDGVSASWRAIACHIVLAEMIDTEPGEEFLCQPDTRNGAEAGLSEALVRQFGHAAISIAAGQAARSGGDVGETWKRIVAYLSRPPL